MLRGWPGIAVVSLVSALASLAVRRYLGRSEPGRRFVATPGTGWAVWCLLALVCAALIAPLLAPADPVRVLDLVADRLVHPGWAHPLGTDGYARDVLSRLLYGARTALLVATVAVTVSSTLGLAVGLTSGLARGWVDTVIMRMVDAALAVPRLFLVLVVVALSDRPSPLGLALLLGLTGWFAMSRLIRAETLAVRDRDYVASVVALGARPVRVAVRHVLPQIAATATVAGSLNLANVLLVEAGLAYLGLSVRAPSPTWGFMVSEATPYLRSAPWLVGVPGLAIACTVLAVNLLSDGLRAALNPRASG